MDILTVILATISIASVIGCVVLYNQRQNTIVYQVDNATIEQINAYARRFETMEGEIQSLKLRMSELHEAADKYYRVGYQRFYRQSKKIDEEREDVEENPQENLQELDLTFPEPAPEQHVAPVFIPNSRVR